MGSPRTMRLTKNETFSPVVRLNSISIILSLAVNQGWSLHQLDVSSSMPSSMVILLNVSLWSNHLGMLFMGRLPRYVISIVLSMVWSRAHVHGLKNSISLSSLKDWLLVKWTLLSFGPLLLLDASYWLCMLMISSSLEVTLLALLELRVIYIDILLFGISALRSISCALNFLIG